MHQDATLQACGVNGCCGGDPADTMEWIAQQGGIPTAAAYGDTYTRREAFEGNGLVSTAGDGITYSGNNPTTNYPCKQNIAAAVTLNTVGGDNFEQWSTEQDMANHLCSTGSLSIIVSTEGWDGYTGGIMSASTCGSQVDHAVLLVGATVGSDADGTQYWKVQNSWGEDWVSLCVASAHAGGVQCCTGVLYNCTVLYHAVL